MADVGNLVAKLTLDTAEFSKGAGEIKGMASDLAGGVGNVLGGVTAAVGAAVTAAAAGVASMVKSAVTSFADYEQLVGGVETLFKDSAGIVQDYAMEAYKTAGISANEYMSTVTSFSASLLQSLGGDTKAAADMADQAIIDMADNANKMGTDMTAIQNAYQGFAKQNYTMLDNLKLGYGGTQAEMERLIRDAEKLDSSFSVVHQKTKKGNDELVYSFADIVQAIHIVQDEMGITGTTAEEAEKTISGSWNMVKASWNDLLTSLAGGGKGLSESISALVESTKTFISNLLPVVKEALYGIGDLIKELAPIIAEELPGLIAEVAPMLIDAAMSIVESLTQALPDLIEALMQTVSDILPQIAETVVSLLDVLVGTIIPALLELAGQLVMELGRALLDNIDELSSAALNLLTGFIEFMTEALPMLITIATQIILSLATFIAENAEMIITGVIALIMAVIQALLDNMPTLLEAGIILVKGLVDGLLSNLPLISDSVVILIVTLVKTIIENLPMILAAALEIGAKIVAGIVCAIPNLIISVGKMLGIVDDTKNQMDNHANKMQSSVNTTTTGINTDINGMIDNLNSKTSSAKDALKSTSSYTGQVKDEMNKKADDLQKTAAEVQRSTIVAYENIQSIIAHARATLQSDFERMEVSMTTLIVKFEELGAINAQPKVDSSGVEKGCTAIVTAVEQAISALNRLSSASAGGGGGFGGGHASGGWMSAGTTYLVGELGPELVTPTRSGYVHTADETSDILGGGGQTINITIQGDVYDDEWSMRDKMRTAVLDVLNEELSYG